MKSNKLSILFTIISVVLALISLSGVAWDKELVDHAVHMQFILYPILFALFMVILFIVLLAKKEKAVILPLLGFLTTGLIFIKKVVTFVATNSSILDIVSPTDNTSVLTVLLFIGFIVCVFASLYKGCKYTNLYVAGYFTLLILTTINFLPEIIATEELTLYTFITFSMIAGYLSFVIFFLGGKKQEEKKEEKLEAKEETKAE